jgi:hypothetical protein
MTTEETFRPIGPPPKRWKLFAPVLALLALALGLFAFWFHVSRGAGTAFDAWVEREKTLGRIWTCGERGIAGFPFRLEITCKDARFTRTHGDVPVARGALATITAVTQIYQPDLALVFFEGPLRLEGRRDGDVLDLQWSSFRGSLRGRPGAPVRISFEATGLDGTFRNAGGVVDRFTAEKFEAHLRRDPERFETERAYNIAGKVVALSSGLLEAAAAGGGAAGFEASLTLTRAEPFSGAGFPAEAERWRKEGGRLLVTDVRLSKGDRRFQASGELALDGAHRPEGRVEVALTGFADLMKGLNANPQLGLLFGLRRGEAGVQQIKLPLRAERGMLSIGPLALFPLAPLY